MIVNEVRECLKKVCEVLNSNHVEYLVVGGAAVSYYGFNRPSGIGNYHSELKVDLDFWYNPTIANFHNLLNALDKLDIDTGELRSKIFDKKKTYLKIPLQDFHTDFLPLIEGTESFPKSLKKAEFLMIEELRVPIISIEDLLANKKKINRPSDQLDIEKLEDLRKKRPDQIP